MATMYKGLSDEDIDLMKEKMDEEVESTIAMLNSKKKKLVSNGVPVDSEEVMAIDEQIAII
tara:strand:+ start:197 stop:379 length:183 start_codon:yes stop_codon:yes gene_type:complete